MAIDVSVGSPDSYLAPHCQSYLTAHWVGRKWYQTRVRNPHVKMGVPVEVGCIYIGEIPPIALCLVSSLDSESVGS